MRALITGGGGQLARELVSAAPSGMELVTVSRAECDITDLLMVERVMTSVGPDVVINTAAYTKVDAAERDQDSAYRVNALGAENVAKAVTRSGSRLIHVSTDYVFDGERSTPYPPDATPNPINVYGASKLGGEEAIRRECPKSLIMRAGWLYSISGRSFAFRILNLLRAGETPEVVTDFRGTPTLAQDLAEILWLCTLRPDLMGIYHFANAGDASWYEFACEIRSWVVREKPRVPLPEIRPITAAEYNAPALRPRYTVLDSSALIGLLGCDARSWQAALRQALAEKPPTS